MVIEDDLAHFQHILFLGLLGPSLGLCSWCCRLAAAAAFCLVAQLADGYHHPSPVCWYWKRRRHSSLQLNAGMGGMELGALRLCVGRRPAARRRLHGPRLDGEEPLPSGAQLTPPVEPIARPQQRGKKGHAEDEEYQSDVPLGCAEEVPRRRRGRKRAGGAGRSRGERGPAARGAPAGTRAALVELQAEMGLRWHGRGRGWRRLRRGDQGRGELSRTGCDIMDAAACAAHAALPRRACVREGGGVTVLATPKRIHVCATEGNKVA